MSLCSKQPRLLHVHKSFFNTFTIDIITLLVGINIMASASMIKDQDTTLAIETFNPDYQDDDHDGDLDGDQDVVVEVDLEQGPALVLASPDLGGALHCRPSLRH